MARRRKGRPIHGWLILDKPAGPSSAAVVGRVKRLFEAAKLGHAGTLDPLASGVLPVIPAIISALEDALAPFRVRLAQAPVSPADIIAAIDAAKAR